MIDPETVRAVASAIGLPLQRKCKMDFKQPMVGNEPVTILEVDGEKQTGVLGAVVRDANILVRYPDGEQGYVQAGQIYEGATT